MDLSPSLGAQGSCDEQIDFDALHYNGQHTKSPAIKTLGIKRCYPTWLFSGGSSIPTRNEM